MSAAAITERVDSDIGGIDSNEIGSDFRPCLLAAPELAQLKEHDGRLNRVWIALREPDGYYVLFDPAIETFSLATGGTLVGIYGGFMDTLNAM